MSDFNLIKLCENAKKASKDIVKLTTNEKNKILNEVARALITNAEDIINANLKDMENAKANNMPESLLDRLLLDKSRIEGMAEGLNKVALLEDPVGEVTEMTKRPNGMVIGKKRVPMGVIGIIYEARPNVTSDAFALCFKTSNIVILKGGSDSINSNIAIVRVIRKVLADNDYNQDFVQLIESTDRETTKEFMKMNKYVDLLIPRGSAGLITATLKNSTIPVIETGTGNCHIFVDESADIKMATDILINAKTQRIGVCNACESLVVHKNIANEFLPQAVAALREKNVEVRGDERVLAICNDVIPATKEDFYTEYLDYIISIKIVDSIDEAIAHINEHNTKHSESIITKDYDNSNKFLEEIDAACVYVNASTRFTDGFEFGFGAEIGISTQKLHARGPMGLRELCTSKYIIYGNGQIR